MDKMAASDVGYMHPLGSGNRSAGCWGAATQEGSHLVGFSEACYETRIQEWMDQWSDLEGLLCSYETGVQQVLIKVLCLKWKRCVHTTVYSASCALPLLVFEAMYRQH